MGIDKDFLYMSDEYEDCDICKLRYPNGAKDQHLDRIKSLFNVSLHKVVYKKPSYVDANSANVKVNGKVVLTYAQAYGYRLGMVQPLNVLGILSVEEKKKV